MEEVHKKCFKISGGYKEIIRKEPSEDYFKYFVDTNKGYISEDCIDIASLYGKLNFIKILTLQGYKPSKHAVEYAYINNWVECLDYLLSIDSPYDYDHIFDTTYLCEPYNFEIDSRCIKLLDNHYELKKKSQVSKLTKNEINC